MGIPPKITKKTAAPRLESLDGKTIYLVDCRFDDSIELLKQVQAWFAEHMPSVTTKLVSLSAYYGHDDPKTWDEIKANGDAAIIGVGHCSTCAPAVSTHAITLETKYGVPTVALHTDKFDKVVQSVRKMAGLPAAPCVFVPQPVMGKTAEGAQAYVEGKDPITGTSGDAGGHRGAHDPAERRDRCIASDEHDAASASSRIPKRICSSSSSTTTGPTSCRSSCRPKKRVAAMLAHTSRKPR